MKGSHDNSETSERIGFEDDGKGLITTIEAYYKPLRAKNAVLPWDAIVFRCGTLVRLDCTETYHHPIDTFIEDDAVDKFISNNFPNHRLPNATYESTRRDNQCDLEWALQKRPEWSTQIKKAYGCLMWSGYPLPGGIGGDRTVFPWSADRDSKHLTYITIFQHLEACCCTLFTLTSVPVQIENKYPQADPAEEDGPYNRLCCIQHDRLLIGSADRETAEMRRLDYMFPKPFAYVDKEMKVHIF